MVIFRVEKEVDWDWKVGVNLLAAGTVVYVLLQQKKQVFIRA